MTLTAADILNCDDSSKEKINIPEWGGDVYIKVMSGSERDSWELYYGKEIEKTNSVNVRSKLAGLTLCDEQGKRLFSDGQIAALGKKSGSALERVYVESLRINKVTESDIEALEKN